MSEIEQPSPWRRNLLKTSTLGALAIGAAFSGGVKLGTASVLPTPPTVSGRRRFENKVIVVTGATSGIGRSAAEQFAAEGGKVAFCGRRRELGGEVEASIRAHGGEALYVPCDVRVENEVATFIDKVVAHYGRLDVAFNNAGITLERPLHEYTAEEWDDVLHTNLRGVFFAMKYEIPHMLGSGGGNIVVTSSSNALTTTAKRGAYTASKRALVGLVQCAALDYIGRNIRINTLVPGTTDTALVRRDVGMENAPDMVWEVAAHEWAKSHIPLGRMATSAEVAAFALTLASDEHPFMTGAQMVLDGGKTIQGA